MSHFSNWIRERERIIRKHLNRSFWKIQETKVSAETYHLTIITLLLKQFYRMKTVRISVAWFDEK